MANEIDILSHNIGFLIHILVYNKDNLQLQWLKMHFSKNVPNSVFIMWLSSRPLSEPINYKCSLSKIVTLI